jgi:hypothetical protein
LGEQPPASADAPPVDLDISFFSQASSMNMSIGARAAMNEHLRCINKYGLDVSTTQDVTPQHATNPLDEEWDRLVEGRDSPHDSNIISLEDTVLNDTTIGEGYESIEVMTSVSIDYFNTSRVNLLRTPTKNRSRRFNAVSTRGGERSFNQSSLLDDDDDSDSDSGQSATMLRMCQQANAGLSPRKATPPDQSFASFSALDISRISADGIEGGGGLRRSPDCSFQDHRSTIDDPLDHHQSFLFRDTSGVLSPRSSPPRSETQRRNLHDFSTPKRGRRRSSAVGISKEKENAPSDDYFKDVIGLSPIGNRIRDPPRNSKISSQPDISFSTIEEGAHSFLHNIDEAAAHAPSLFHSINEAPQTQETTESLTDLSVSRLKIVEYNQTQESEISTLNSSSAGKNKGLGSSGSIHFSPGSPLDLLDRRRYRTVVPSRVFMTETDDDFPEQYDSFSAPAPHTTPLLDSFDDAFYRSGFSDPT